MCAVYHMMEYLHTVGISCILIDFNVRFSNIVFSIIIIVVSFIEVSNLFETM